MNKLLIANRGEIARRVMRTCREMGIATVAVFSQPDLDAPFVEEADEAIALGGATPAESYLRIDRIIDAARRSGAQAIHPGYGFLAENAELARACAAASIVFIGPSAEAIAAMGSKIEAKRRMREAGVPVLGSVEVETSSSADIARQASQLGWPVLVKASAGGGGRGMRIVHRAEELAAAIHAASREAQSAFGDGSVFLEPYVESPRHIEVQVFGDTHGEVIHLFERECSIQRRHQKILEEAPSVAVDERLRIALGDAAVRAARAVNYVGAGTVEFLLAPDREFFFLEMNTRLQVEHPVTECVTGLDLVRMQIEIARGEPISASARGASLAGHAIEVRLYAEDPSRDFMPTTGALHRFQIDSAPRIRVESAVRDGSRVSPFYDSLLAKIIVHAPNRPEAACRLAAALSRARIHGVQTNRELLVRLLEHPEFLAGRTDTHFLSRHDPKSLGGPLGDERVQRLHALAATLAGAAERRREATVQRTIPAGWRNNPSQLQQARFAAPSGEISIGYRSHRGSLTVEVNGEAFAGVRVESCMSECVRMEIDGTLRTFDVHRVGNTHFVDSTLGASELRELDRFPVPEEDRRPGSLLAPLPGVVVEVKVQPGDTVAEGDVLVVIESMKMLHSVAAPQAGNVAEIRVSASQHVEAGAILAVIADET